MRQCEIEGHRSCATPDDFAKVGPEPTTAAVERREASIPRHGMQGASQRLRAYVIGPPTGAAAPERLSALRSPHFVARGHWQTSEEHLPRENDEACSNLLAVIPGSPLARRPGMTVRQASCLSG